MGLWLGLILSPSPVSVSIGWSLLPPPKGLLFSEGTVFDCLNHYCDISATPFCLVLEYPVLSYYEPVGTGTGTRSPFLNEPWEMFGWALARGETLGEKSWWAMQDVHDSYYIPRDRLNKSLHSLERNLDIWWRNGPARKQYNYLVLEISLQNEVFNFVFPKKKLLINVILSEVFSHCFCSWRWVSGKTRFCPRVWDCQKAT